MERPHPDAGEAARDRWIEDLRQAVRSALCTLQPEVVQSVLGRIANSDARLWEVVKGIDLGPDGAAMVMQAVARHLMEGKPMSVIKGPRFARG